jgi:hypothetical protein
VMNFCTAEVSYFLAAEVLALNSKCAEGGKKFHLRFLNIDGSLSPHPIGPKSRVGTIISFGCDEPNV